MIYKDLARQNTSNSESRVNAGVASDLDLDFIDTRVGEPLPLVTPEPTSIILLGVGLAGIGCGYLRRRIKRS